MKKSLTMVLSMMFAVLFVACNGSSDTAGSGETGGEATPLSIPGEVEDNCIGFLTYSTNDFATIHTVGAAWARPHPGPFVWGSIETSNGTFNFADADEIVAAAQTNNVAILGTIWPFADWDQTSCRLASSCQVSPADQFYPGKGGDGIPSYRCAPCNYDDYNEFLTTLVERYDGDGIDDMSGLTLPIKYWEILNEPEMDSDTLTFFNGTAEEYIQLLQESYATTKGACSDCTVVQGGAAGSDTTNIIYWGTIFDLGGGDYFDVANIHCINCSDMETLNVQAFANLLSQKGISKPIWVTEAEFVSEDEVENAAQGALTAGASKVFYVGLVIGSYSAPEGEYSQVFADTTSLCP